MLIELLYTSEATDSMSDAELKALLATSRRNNPRHGITGMLIFHRNAFLQLLEGDEREVMRLYQTILGDTRHRGSRVVWKGPVTERCFPEWSMAFRALDDSDLEQLDGYSDLLDSGFSGPFLGDNPTAAQSLMRIMADID